MNRQHALLIDAMASYDRGSAGRIQHFVKVHDLAAVIGTLEGLDEQTQFILETAAIVHDIGCPLCREKYGNTNGKRQEEEGAPMAAAFLEDSGMTAAQVERVSYLVGHHHTFAGIDGIDYQILIEADYIANATENGYSLNNVRNFAERMFKTAAGKRLLKSIFGV